MAKLSIAIDIDDVLADSTEAIRSFANQRTGIALTSEDYKNPVSTGGIMNECGESMELGIK